MSTSPHICRINLELCHTRGLVPHLLWKVVGPASQGASQATMCLFFVSTPLVHNCGVPRRVFGLEPLFTLLCLPTLESGFRPQCAMMPWPVLALSIFRLLFGAYTGFLWAQSTHFFQTYLRSELNLQPKRNYKNSSSHTSRVSTWTFIKGDPLSKYLGLSVLSHIKGNSFCQSRKLL